MKLTWHASFADIAPALWNTCFPPPLEGRWWYETLEGSGLEDQFTFMYGVVSDATGALAIAPAFLMDVPIRLVVPPELLPVVDLLGRWIGALRQQRTLFVGSPCSDEGTVGIVPGADRLAVLRCVHAAVRERARELRAPMLVWKDFPASFDADMAVVARENGLFRLISFPGTVAALPGKDVAGYLASLGSQRRHQLKKKLRSSHAAAELDVSVLVSPDARTLDEVFALFEQTWAKATTRFERLDRRFFERIAQQAPSRFIVLRERAGGAMVAFMLCFELPGHAINKFIGIDYQRPKDWFLYFRLWEAAVAWATSRGAATLQSGQTGYAAKIRLGHRLVPLTNHCAHRNPLIHRVYARVARTVNWHTLDADLAEHLKAHPDQAPA